MTSVKKLEGWDIYFNRPEGEPPHLPADITDLTSENLGKLFTELTSWSDYVASQVTVAQLEERSALKKLDFEENKMLVSRMGAQTKGERVTTVKAEIAIHPTIVELSEEHEKAYIQYKFLAMLADNLERDLQLVSREITRRNNEQRTQRF